MIGCNYINSQNILNICSHFSKNRKIQSKRSKVPKFRRNLMLRVFLTNRKKLKNRMLIKISNTIVRIKD